MTQSLIQRVEKESMSAGLTLTDAQSSIMPGDLGDGHIVGRFGPLLVRFVRDRGQDWMELGPSDATPPCFFSFQDVQIALGWKTVDQVLEMKDVEPLRQVLQTVADRWSELVHNLSGGVSSLGWRRVKQAADTRGEAFAERLR